MASPPMQTLLIRGMASGDIKGLLEQAPGAVPSADRVIRAVSSPTEGLVSILYAESTLTIRQSGVARYDRD